MLAVARERHPRQSVGHIRLLSSPDPPGGGGEGLGERGGKNKALKLLQSKPARPLNDFYTASPYRTSASSYRLCSNSCAATPTLTPNPSPAPPGGKGGPTALCGRMLEVVEFTVNRQPSNGPSTAVCGRVFKGAAFTVPRQPSKSTQAVSVGSQAHVVLVVLVVLVVPGDFECWPLHVNATPHKALAK